MIWNELINCKIEYIVNYLNDELNKTNFDELCLALKTTVYEVTEYMSDFGYIKKKNSNEFTKSMYSDHMIEKSYSNLSQDEIMILKKIAKKYKGKDETIFIDLPSNKLKQTTIRVNEVAWDEFNKFAEETDHNKYELLSMALIEYIKNHR